MMEWREGLDVEGCEIPKVKQEISLLQFAGSLAVRGPC